MYSGDNPKKYNFVSICSHFSSWVLDVYVKPTKNTAIVIISTVTILILLGIIILYYHLKEKEEDKKAQEQYLDVFT